MERKLTEAGRRHDDRLTKTELRELLQLSQSLVQDTGDMLSAAERKALRQLLLSDNVCAAPAHDDKGLPKALMALRTASVFAGMVDHDRNIIVALLLDPALSGGHITTDGVRSQWGDDIASLLEGEIAVERFSGKNNAVNQDNFRGLMLSLADDIRVIIMMIVRSLVLMRTINHHPDEAWVRDVAFEANCLYAQLAHRLGLYKIKGELEDLSLKYTNREIYTQIAHKLNETKRDRDAYIAAFIAPVRQKLTEAGLRFDIKGRTKSISSIWSKMKKQKVDLDRIYDLFAIRVIIDTPREREKSDCWLAYSILADMYTANPARMKDWISLPKSNGYESLHATVMGPGSKWVEVQFRSRRMDLVAEKGLAAHWRYKGVKGDSTDQWMNNIRDILETAEAGPMQLMKDMKMDVWGREVFAFTPKGDLFRLPSGATVLDFAFHIHTNVGARCTGAVVNGAHRKISYRIENGDTVEILTSSTQQPRQEWLGIVVSSKARNKIKQSLNEQLLHQAELGKEMLARRAKNRKIDLDESELMRLIKKQGYKYANEFYADMAGDKIDPGRFLATYAEAVAANGDEERVSAEEFRIIEQTEPADKSEVLTVGGKTISGLRYKFARCCNPIYGDDVFGFISSEGVIKVHRRDCPNAANIRERYPYRLIRVDWSGHTGEAMAATLRILGVDDIGIVTNITSLISKETGAHLRNISVDSHDGLFQGVLVITVKDQRQLTAIVKKIKGVKGIKSVERL